MQRANRTYSYKDLFVWQRSMMLVKEVYELTAGLPEDEKYGLISQMRRAAVSILSNIAEGHLRRHKKEFLHFSSVALGSAGELETQLLLCQSLHLCSALSLEKSLESIDIIKRMLYKLSRNLEQISAKFPDA